MSEDPFPVTKIKIESIKCLSASENAGPKEFHDEIFLICQADGGVPIRYPHDLASSKPLTANETWILDDPELVLTFQYEVLITIWDVDVSYDPTVSTFLCCHQYCYNGGLLEPGEQVATPDQNDNGAHYSITSRNVTDDYA